MANPRTNTIVKKSFSEALALGRKDPIDWAWRFLGLDLHDGQKKFITSFTQTGIKEGILSAGNRWGKGETIAPLMLWHAFYQMRDDRFSYDSVGRLRPYTAINVSISLDQASIVFNKMYAYATSSKRFEPFIDRVITSPFPTLTLKDIDGTKAQIWARSTSHGGKYLLGQNFQYLNYDEASLSPDLATIVGDVIRMRLADSGGSMTFTSQPRGKNAFFDIFMRGVENSKVYDRAVYSQYGSSFDNPHIDHEHINRSMKYMTPGQIRENIYGEFSDEMQFFPADTVANCYNDAKWSLPVPPGTDIKQQQSKGEVFAKFEPSNKFPKYVMGVDLASIVDKTCIIVLRVDTKPMQLVYFDLIGRADWTFIKQRITQTHRSYNCWGYIDSTGAGQPVSFDLIDPEGLYRCNIDGFNINVGSKLPLLYDLQASLQAKEVIFPYQQDLVDTLIRYDLKDDKLFTDPVFALALAVKAAKDLEARERIPLVDTPELHPVRARRDRETGLYVFDDDDDEIEYSRPQRRNIDRWSALI